MLGRRVRIVTSSLALVVAAGAGLLAVATPAPAPWVVANYSLTKNIQLITTRVPTKPVEERTLKVSPTAASVPDIVPAAASYPMFDLTSTMAAHAGALAGVNGDFGTAKDQPHAHPHDRRRAMDDRQRDRLERDGWHLLAGDPALRIGVVDGTGAVLFNVDDWNARTPHNTSAIVRRYTAVTQPDPCSQTKLSVGSTAGGAPTRTRARRAG